ncbi:MAG: NifB/NifX family molybdenum-iron cluster-binding protein [Desulfatibacillaceae bacterium]|nr:NifB/NifX family molybdenum-iron cluster-binding protein [Desulfatibacillaceae bacterium]
MKIAVTATGATLDSQVDPRFGRAAYFVVVDAQTMEHRAVENSQNLNLPQGAGIQAGKTVADAGVDAVLTGHCGPKAFAVLKAAGIEIYTGASGTVRQSVEAYKQGKMKAASNADVDGHWA